MHGLLACAYNSELTNKKNERKTKMAVVAVPCQAEFACTLNQQMCKVIYGSTHWSLKAILPLRGVQKGISFYILIVFFLFVLFAGGVLSFASGENL